MTNETMNFNENNKENNAEKKFPKKFQSVRGMRDIVGKEIDTFNKVIEISSYHSRKFGFTPIDTPILEDTALFSKSFGDTSDIVGKEMYTFLDKGGKSVTMRPEGTASIVRACLENKIEIPTKYFYYGPMFRYDRPQKGRYRQFYQFGVEHIGAHSPYNDVDCINLGYKILQSLLIPDFALHINTLGDYASYLSYKDSLISYLEKYKNDLSNDSAERLYKNPLRVLDSKNLKDIEICKDSPKIIDHLNCESKAFFDKVLFGLKEINISFKIDHNLVRGLDYYRHTVFEFKTKSLGSQDALLSGGRYDHLIKLLGGDNTPAIGFASGIDRLSSLMPYSEDEDFKVAIIPISENEINFALSLTDKIRSQGIICEFFDYHTSLKKRFKEIDRKKFDYAIIFGDEELNQNLVKLKDLKSSIVDQHSKQKKEMLVDINEIVLLMKSYAYKREI